MVDPKGNTKSQKSNPPYGPSSHRQPCVAGLKSRSAAGMPTDPRAGSCWLRYPKPGEISQNAAYLALKPEPRPMRSPLERPKRHHVQIGMSSPGHAEGFLRHQRTQIRPISAPTSAATPRVRAVRLRPSLMPRLVLRAGTPARVRSRPSGPWSTRCQAAPARPRPLRAAP